MAEYVEAFNVDSPADDDELEQGDDVIRQFKRAVRERLETFFNSLEDNPLVPKAAARLFSGDLDIAVLDLSVLASQKLYEFDIDVAGAKVGDLAFGEWKADDLNYPTLAGMPPAPGLVTPDVRDLLPIRAWCIADDKVRIRITNSAETGASNVAALAALLIAQGTNTVSCRATVIQVAQALT